MESLPDTLLRDNIFNNLPIDELLAICDVSERFKRICNDEYI